MLLRVGEGECPSTSGAMTLDEAIDYIRRDPRYSDIVRDSYLGEDVFEAAERFETSGEFAEVIRLIGEPNSRVLLDVGAGNGIASWAFARRGFSKVYALEPSASTKIGREVIARLCAGLPVSTIAAHAERIPLPDEAVDVVYLRQVLHHTADLFRALRECARVLKRSGLLFASREHVCDNQLQLEEFLREHPIHQLAGGEYAFPLDSYTAAIEKAGLHLRHVLGPWDSVVNAFPAVRTRDELSRYYRTALERKLGLFGRILSYMPGCRQLVWVRINRRKPGRPYSFLAEKL